MVLALFSCLQSDGAETMGTGPITGFSGFSIWSLFMNWSGPYSMAVSRCSKSSSENIPVDKLEVSLPSVNYIQCYFYHILVVISKL